MLSILIVLGIIRILSFVCVIAFIFVEKIGNDWNCKQRELKIQKLERKLRSEKRKLELRRIETIWEQKKLKIQKLERKII